jgi:hypothetical protein
MHRIANTSIRRSWKRGLERTGSGSAAQRVLGGERIREFRQHASGEPQHGKRRGTSQDPANSARHCALLRPRYYAVRMVANVLKKIRRRLNRVHISRLIAIVRRGKFANQQLAVPAELLSPAIRDMEGPERSPGSRIPHECVEAKLAWLYEELRELTAKNGSRAIAT